ncbi:MAG: P-loop containing nucleoside triphosphate hydrolase protein [Piptocephalis tieghemiana]|nr:MAG: P-loop containing nucleoside triphosphate hydrolase protein [Piptocephalis tieghemiana]
MNLQSLAFWRRRPVEPASLDSKSRRGPLPLLSANILSQITFQWIQPLMSIGYRRPLELSDLYNVPPNIQASTKGDQLARAWEKQLARPNPSLLKAIFEVAGPGFWIAGIFRVLSDAVTVTSPILVGTLTTFVGESAYAKATGTEGPSPGYGYGLCVILLAMNFLSTACLHRYFHVTMRTGIQVRAALITLVYRKAMRLSGRARQTFTAGKVTNLMSTDIARIDMVAQFLQALYTAPIQIAIALGLLIHYIGPSALAGFAVLIIIGPLQTTIIRSLVTLRKHAVAVTDSRVKLTQEILQGIRVIKFYAWESTFFRRIEELRNRELYYLRRLLVIRSVIMSTALVVPIFATMIALIVYNVLGNDFSASTVFTAMSLFSALRVPLMMIPPVISFTTDARVACKRLEELMLAEELDPLPEIEPHRPYALELKNASFAWEVSLTEEKSSKPGSKPSSNSEKPGISASQASAPTLGPDSSSKAIPSTSVTPPPPPPFIHQMNLQIERGSLVAIVGSVGSGKSSLLSALSGEMRMLQGSEMHFGGSVGYSPQTAWIQNATVRDNILFGLPFDQERYDRAIEACALTHDLAVLPDGDMTEIGERGITLSGGQKQRLNIARAVYFNADIILLDDPLSAVDSHVGRHLFDKCILGALSGKTRILVTHQWHFLPRVDRILVIHEGRIIEDGTYTSLMNKENEQDDGRGFAYLMRTYGGGGDDEDDEEKKAEMEMDPTGKNPSDPSATDPTSTKGANDSPSKNGKALMSSEERAIGSVGTEVYKAYVQAGGGFIALLILLILLILMNATRVLNDLWLSWWISQNFGLSRDTYIGVYVAWGVGQTLFTALVGVGFALMSILASKSMHQAALANVFRAPTSFFDTTPLGRIINRFSRDVDTLDSTISDNWRMFLLTFFQVLSVIILISCIFPLFLVPVVPMFGIYWYAQGYYRSSSRELKRLDSLTRSPLLAHFSETLTGLSTIRAYRVQDHFRRVNESLMDSNNEAYYLTIVIQRWLGVRLETVATILIFCATLFAVSARHSVDPSKVGLVISYALQVTGVFTWCVRQAAEVETNMNATERLDHYAHPPFSSSPAKPSLGSGPPPPPEWPAHGAIDFQDVQLSYRPGLPMVLKGISLSIRPGEKVGVVGRTGSGKSTIMLSLFRIVELSRGSIHIDGLDISTVGLKDLRSHLAIIPQDAVLFAGTLRFNLDPYGQHDDEALWSALRRSSLHSFVSSLPNGLDSGVTEGGENFSAGQRQLVCLARAMLVQAKIIVMDEATASVDLETDALLQQSIRTDFAQCTVLAIAHRLNTIMDYDRVLVLSDGHVVEFDTPYRLLTQNAGQGHFAKMVQETGDTNAEMLLEQAEKVARQRGDL